MTVPLLVAIFLQGVLAVQAASVSSKCSSLASFSLDNTTIIKAEYLPAGTNSSHPESCPGIDRMVVNTVDVCRVYGMINTTTESSTRFEAWLPNAEEWYGRFLFVGGGALGGCKWLFLCGLACFSNFLFSFSPGFDIDDVNYGAEQHFATIASDNGVFNNVIGGDQFLNRPETIIDFAFRGAHVTALVGKKLVEAYYSTAPSKSYYRGCSVGGKIGAKFALETPEIFDGIVGGTPAVDFNHFVGWSGMVTQYVRDGTGGAISTDQWAIISKEILKQCDALDGLVDGLIADPNKCAFNPETLLCVDGSASGSCLTSAQVDALRKLYSPLLGSQQQLVYPRFDPGAEADAADPILGEFAIITSVSFVGRERATY